MKIKMLVLFLIALTLSGCRYGRGVRGDGHLTEKAFNVSEFNKIELGGIYSVDITLGNKQTVKVKAEKNLMKYLVVKVNDNTLVLDNKRSISPRKGIKVVIVAKTLRGIEASGASFIAARNINSDDFDIGISGASKVEISGRAEKLSLDISGAGNLYAKNFICKKITADISGAAHTIVNVTDLLDADVSGAASLNYYGNPKNIRFNTSGAGSITKK